MARVWHAKQKPRWKPGHPTDVLASLVTDVFPKIGALPISAVTSNLLIHAGSDNLAAALRRATPDDAYEPLETDLYERGRI